MAKLSTHVLDTSRGLPAQGVAVDLYRVNSAAARTHLATSITNADGRTNGPLLEGDHLTTGRYELIFHVSDYFALPFDPPFFEDIVIRFGICDATRNHHVPLLLSPYGYSTYRGS